MTIKERAVALKKVFPDAGDAQLAKIIGCDRNTIKFHLYSVYRKNQIKKNTANLKERVKKHKFILVQFLGGQCSECGYRGCLSALEFHHKDPSTKIDRGVSDVLSGSFERALEEAKKCVLLCGNCHQELHEKENNLSIEQSAGIQGVGKTGEGAGPQTLRLNPN